MTTGPHAVSALLSCRNRGGRPGPVSGELKHPLRFVGGRTLRYLCLGGRLFQGSLSFQETRRQNIASLEVTRRGQVTDRFTKAIEQLGEEKLDVRLGGIYALEQIARDSPDLHWPVIEVLMAFIREHAKRSPGAQPDREQSERDQELASDIQAALTILGKRDPNKDLGSVNLSGTNLQGADLREAKLQRANFANANLQRASFQAANLQEANFFKANLQRATFQGSRHDQANFLLANVGGAFFEVLRRLWESRWPAATGLTWEQLGKAEGVHLSHYRSIWHRRRLMPQRKPPEKAIVAERQHGRVTRSATHIERLSLSVLSERGSDMEDCAVVHQPLLRKLPGRLTVERLSA